MTPEKPGHGPLPPYGNAMTEAIGSGDVAKMQQVRDQALAHLSAAADITKLLPALEKAIQSKGGPIRPLYAVAIQDAVARGDAAEIARIKAELASYTKLLG